MKIKYGGQVAKEKPWYWINVAKTNRQQLKAFKAVPYCQRLLSLPHCLSKALIDEISLFAQGLGYHVSVAEGGTDVENSITELQPGAVVGIACMKEIFLAAKSLGIPFQAIELTTFGCKKHNSTFDLDKVKAILALCST
ncbi:DUF116 domain-containing protein [Patescibacteria group bacterium]|nr:DUF116 domain-containing protein [Patescibacteria group bacterium]MBU0964055.1 DUF116 domain-containing protein [Patescibacteria group bacterium]